MTVSTRLQSAEVISPAPRDVWQQLYDGDADAVPTLSPAWADCLGHETGWADVSRLYRLDDGRRLVVPLAAPRVAGVRVAHESWPYGWGYGGALVEGGVLHEEDARIVLADLRRTLRVRATVNPMPLLAAPWDAAAAPEVQRIRYRSEIVDLAGGVTAVHRRFSKAVRRAQSSAQRRGVEVHRDTTGQYAPDFAQLYAASVDRWAAQRGQPLVLARALARWRDRAGQAAAVMAALGNECVTWVATWRGEVVAVSMVLVHGTRAYNWMGVVDRELTRATNGGMLLDVVAIEDACVRGATAFIFGESEPGGPVERYKRQFGGSGVDYCALRMERGGVTPAADRARRAAEGVLALRARRREDLPS